MGGKGENSVTSNGMQERAMEEGGGGEMGVTANHGFTSSEDRASSFSLSVPFLQKVTTCQFVHLFLFIVHSSLDSCLKFDCFHVASCES